MKNKILLILLLFTLTSCDSEEEKRKRDEYGAWKRQYYKERVVVKECLNGSTIYLSMGKYWIYSTRGWVEEEVAPGVTLNEICQ